MNKTAIIIPSRLDAQRLPNKPLKLINNKEMILHVYEAAKKTNAEEVYLATPDQKIIDVIKKIGGKAFLQIETIKLAQIEFLKFLKKSLNSEPNIIVNLQGDMPNIHPDTINNLIDYMKKNECEIGTLASKLSSQAELGDENVVKVLVKEKLKSGMYVKALDFVRNNNIKEFQAYHHIGIYAFTNKALLRYVGLERSKLEIERKLEQLRAMENGMSIVGYINSSPLSVDTKKDLMEVKK